jgi:hypothetical protein
MDEGSETEYGIGRRFESKLTGGFGRLKWVHVRPGFILAMQEQAI